MKTKLVLAILTFLSTMSFAKSGGIVGNGADDTVNSFVWFLGTETIQACYKVAPDFPLDQSEINELVATGFSTWEKYVKIKNLKSVWPKDRPFLNFKYKLSAACKGTEDITFYFGVQEPKIDEMLKLYKTPKAFSRFESFDSVKGHGKGYVWFQNKFEEQSFWDPYGQLLGLLVHEMGHVYGNAHVAGTIMREDLAGFMMNANPMTMSHEAAEKVPTAIDQQRELFFAFDSGVSALSDLILAPTDAQKEIFRKLFKREIGGAVEMGFKQGVGSQCNLGQLFIGDETGDIRPQPFYRYGLGANGYEPHETTRKLKGGVFNIEFDLGTKFDFSGSDSPIFQSVWAGKTISLQVPGFVIQGKLIINKQTGESIPVTYSRNRGLDEQVKLLFGTTNGSKEFFKSDLSE